MPPKLASVIVFVAAAALGGCVAPTAADDGSRRAHAGDGAPRAAAENPPVAPGDDRAGPAPLEVIELEPRPVTGDELECRTEVVTGSHRRQEVCMTRDQRRVQREAAQEWLRSNGRDGSVSAVPAAR